MHRRLPLQGQKIGWLGMGGPSSLASSIGQSKDKMGTIGIGSE